MALGTKGTVKLLIGFGALAGLGLLGYEVVYWLTHVYASGARVQTELTRMAARVDGTVATIHVREGDRVKAEQLLISLVDDDIKLRIELLETDRSLERARRERLSAERVAFEIDLHSRIATKRERMRAIEVEHRAINDRLALAEKDLARVKVLFNKALTAERELAIEQDKVLVLRGEAAVSRAKLRIAHKELEQVEAGGRQVDVLDERLKVSHLTEEKIRTMIAAARVALSLRHIRSPLTGIVDRVYKHKGEYVQEGESILILHDEKLFWVEAYVDEDQIRHIRVGQTVVLELEAHPFRDFLGRVVSIGSATTKEMGLSDTRTSQFGRLAERVPVRISLDAPPPGLTPGMVANINVRMYE